MTWRDLITDVLKTVTYLDNPVDVLIDVPTSESDVMARDVSLHVRDAGEIVIRVHPKTALMTERDVEDARREGRNQAEREAEKAAMEKAERETEAELGVWLGKRIGV